MDSCGRLRVAFIVGAPRSGTSLVYRALCLHPRAAWLSNWLRRMPWCLQLAGLNRLARATPALRRRAWFRDDGNAYVYGERRALWRRLYPSPVEGEPVFARCGIPPQGGVADAAQLGRLQRAFATVTRVAGGDVLVSKRIANNRRIPLLLAAFPSARFVEIVRDGRAVAYSLSRVEWWPGARLWWAGVTPTEWARRGGNPWELCARAWVAEVDAVKEGLTRADPRQVLRIRYEDLVDDPIRVLEEVGAFVGLPPDPGWRSELARLSFPDRNEAWRRALSAEARATIERVQAPLLERFGYC